MANDFETEEIPQENEVARPEPGERRALSLPLTLTLVALLIWFGFQTVSLVLERNQLNAVKRNFDAALQEAQKMQAQLQALVSQTSDLASKGNPSAKAVIEELAKKGIPLPSTPAPAK
jgi:cell division protein FtsB